MDDRGTSPSSPQPGALGLRRKLGAEFDKLVETWLLWVTAGALSGVLAFSPTLESPTGRDARPAPSATEIEQAVALAEAEGIAAGAAIRARR